MINNSLYQLTLNIRMIKCFLYLALICLAFTTNAQFAEGTKALSLNVSFSKKDGYEKPNAPLSLRYDIEYISASPKFGVFIAKNLAVGALLEGSYYRIKFLQNEFDNTTESYSAGIFITRYITISEKFLFSIEGQTKLTRGNETQTEYNSSIGFFQTTKFNYNSLTVKAIPAFTYLPNSKLGLHASIGNFSHTIIYNVTVDDRANETQFNFGSFSFGISYFF